ncbi:MAG: OmpA family protein [Candidatus Kapaibacterium sp.]
MIRSSIAALLIALAGYGMAHAQQDTSVLKQDPLTRYGIYGDIGYNIHSADFKELRNCPSCAQRFTSGTGLGYAFGLLFELPVSDQFLLGLRGGYVQEGATLTTIEKTTVIVGNATTEGEFDHTITANIGTVGLEPMLGYRPTDWLIVYGGGRVAYLLTKSFEQKETLAKPDVGTFENFQRVRNIYTGDIPDASTTMVSALVGVGTELPLNRDRTLLLAPELFYNYGITSVRTDSSWHTGGFHLGVALKYGSLRAPITPPAVIVDVPKDTMPVHKPILAAAVTAVGVDSNGTTLNNFQLRVEEFISVSMRPLLNYVFFDDSSSAIPSRYTRMTPTDAAGFQLASLHDVSTLPTYYNLLNILGKRMSDNPGTSITLTGCNSGAGGEKGNTALSRQRATAIRDYLRDVWGVAEGRVKVTARDLPENPSSVTEPDGVAENRRVEITSDSWAIVEPVVTNDTIRTANPPVVRFNPTTRSEAGVTGWTLSMGQEGKELRRFTGEGDVPSSVEWKIDLEKEHMPRAPVPLEYSLEVRDGAGQTFTTNGTLPVEQVTVRKKRVERIADKQIDRYSLIIFDFDKGDLNETNRKIAQFIKARIRPTAAVTIEGSTDRIGEAEYNKRLSEERARSTARALGVADGTVRGIGESSLYDNDLPEGRFYCRTVSIVVETPVVE